MENLVTFKAKHGRKNFEYDHNQISSEDEGVEFYLKGKIVADKKALNEFGIKIKDHQFIEFYIDINKFLNRLSKQDMKEILEQNLKPRIVIKIDQYDNSIYSAKIENKN